MERGFFFSPSVPIFWLSLSHSGQIRGPLLFGKNRKVPNFGGDPEPLAHSSGRPLRFAASRTADVGYRCEKEATGNRGSTGQRRIVRVVARFAHSFGRPLRFAASRTEFEPLPRKSQKPGPDKLDLAFVMVGREGFEPSKA